MKQSDMKKTIVSAYNNVTPDCLEQIKRNCKVTEQVDYDIYSNNNSKKSFFNTYRIFAMSVCLLIAVISSFAFFRVINYFPAKESQKIICQETKPAEIQDEFTVAGQPISLMAEQIAIVYLDVNPSIEVKIDSNMNVLDCIAINEDAEIILKDMDLTGKTFMGAFSQIVISLKNHGYLQGETDAILVSVDTEAEEISNSIQQNVEVVLKDNSPVTELIMQVILNDENLEKKAHDYHISEGKMAFVDKVISSSMEYTEEDILELTSQTIRTLCDILEGKQVNIRGLIENTQNTEESIGGDNPDSTNVVNPVMDTITEINSAVDDQNENIGNVIEQPLGIVSEVLEEPIDYAEDVIDEAFDITEGVVSEIIGTDNLAEELLEDTHEIIGDGINSVDYFLKNLWPKP